MYRSGDGAGETVAVSTADWQRLVIHTAPVDKSCQGEPNPEAGERICAVDAMDEPEGWDKAGFETSDWPQAVVFSEREVRLKDGEDRTERVEDSRVIWRADLKQSNILLCRVTVE
ncbi:MAG: hypothetical protein NXH97_16230 [Rhodobacteraceae bacterium]|nr:hypothetical protein [Paracoccaceae bacterium]